MIRNVVILFQIPVSKRYYDRFGIEILARDFNVRVLDCTPWLKPEFWQVYSDNRHEFSGYYAIENWQDFESKARMGSDTIVIENLGNCSTSEKIRKALRKWKIRRAIQTSSILLPRSRGFGDFLNRVRRGHVIRRGLKKLKGAITSAVKARQLPDIAVLAGEADFSDYKAKVNHIILAHHPDYDIYLSLRHKLPIKKLPYAVFLDEDIGFHPDYLHHGLTAPASEENYFLSLNRFLNAFENLTGQSVVIAAHPRSRYDLRPHLFPGRQVVLSKTAELVRDASLVFEHCSDSATFAVLWEKPIIFLTTNELQESWMGPLIDVKRDFFNAPLINIDSFCASDINLQAWSQIEKSIYDKYKRLYIKIPNTPERPLWEIFSGYVRDNLN